MQVNVHRGTHGFQGSRGAQLCCVYVYVCVSARVCVCVRESEKKLNRKKGRCKSNITCSSIFDVVSKWIWIQN